MVEECQGKEGPKDILLRFWTWISKNDNEWEKFIGGACVCVFSLNGRGVKIGGGTWYTNYKYSMGSWLEKEVKMIKKFRSYERWGKHMAVYLILKIEAILFSGII